jgi:endonuclease/exonuclease/phosphatase family metal-dependent hydrolase
MNVLRAVTINIWNRQGPWDRRLPLLRDGLAALAPDVVGLQEVLALAGRSQADEIADGLGWHVHYAPAWTIGGGLTWGNAILSRWPLARSEVLPLPAPPELDSRSIAFAVLDAPCGQVPVFCTHLTYQLHRSDARCAQVRALADHVAALAPPDQDPFPPILLGDLNADPDSDEMRFLRGLTPLGGRSVYFADCWAASAGQDPAAGPGWTYDRRNPYALRSREPSRRIDYVYVRGPDRSLRGEPLSARLVLDRPDDDGVWPSDHFGLLAEIQAAPRPHDPY